MTTDDSPAPMVEPPPPPELEPAEVQEQLRDFLKNWSLYRRLTLRLAQPVDSLDFPATVAFPCSEPSCRDEPTTTWKTEVSSKPEPLIHYMCQHCHRRLRSFWISTVKAEPHSISLPGPTHGTMPTGDFRMFTFCKIGQTPAWDIQPPKEVEKALTPENLDLYKKGLVCMSQSYGIGAVGYFRRVVENAADKLLDLVEAAATADGDDAALSAVREARGQRQADQKLKLAAAAVPASLRPGGVNPLATLYGDYSRGLHELSDEECLAVATEMRDAFDYVFGNLSNQLARATEYREKIRKRTKP